MSLLLALLQSKRAAREAVRGFDAGAVNRELRSFVELHGDMIVLPSCGKQGLVG